MTFDHPEGKRLIWIPIISPRNLMLMWTNNLRFFPLVANLLLPGCFDNSVVDLGEGPGPSLPILSLKKIESQKEEKPAGKATKNSRSGSANVIYSSNILKWPQPVEIWFEITCVRHVAFETRVRHVAFEINAVLGIWTRKGEGYRGTPRELVTQSSNIRNKNKT